MRIYAAVRQLRCLVCGKLTTGRVGRRPICPKHGNDEVQALDMARPRRPGDSEVRIIRPPAKLA
jgi:hypothetical protein